MSAFVIEYPAGLSVSGVAFLSLALGEEVIGVLEVGRRLIAPPWKGKVSPQRSLLLLDCGAIGQKHFSAPEASKRPCRTTETEHPKRQRKRTFRYAPERKGIHAQVASLCIDLDAPLKGFLR
jgi:hypothetical protein